MRSGLFGWAWAALQRHLGGQPAHEMDPLERLIGRERVREHYRRLSAARDTLVTSNLVISETATRLRYDAGLRFALAFRALVAEAIEAGRLGVRYTDAELDARAWDVMERYDDHRLSFADCVGAVTARESRADAVFGLDADFAALGFALEP